MFQHRTAHGEKGRGSVIDLLNVTTDNTVQKSLNITYLVMLTLHQHLACSPNKTIEKVLAFTYLVTWVRHPP
jgi:hypothetical protein